MSLVLGLEHSCPWPREESVLWRAVLGLGFFLSPWSWPRASCPRLHLCLFSLSSSTSVFNHNNLCLLESLPFYSVKYFGHAWLVLFENYLPLQKFTWLWGNLLDYGWGLHHYHLTLPLRFVGLGMQVTGSEKLNFNILQSLASFVLRIAIYLVVATGNVSLVLYLVLQAVYCNCKRPKVRCRLYRYTWYSRLYAFQSPKCALVKNKRRN